MTQDKKVIIIGAGLAGLTLANALYKQGIPFAVYERDTGVKSRAQGWSLGIHMALNTLKESVPEGHFDVYPETVCVVPNAKDMSFKFMVANTEDVIMQMSVENGLCYRSNRRKLREWLHEPVQDHVYWDKKASHYEEGKDHVTVFFDDGTQAMGSLLVATDGAHSPIATQLFGGKEKFNELTNVSDVRVFGAVRTIPRSVWDAYAPTPQYFFSVMATLKDDKNDEIKGNGMAFFCSVQDYDVNKSEVDIIWSMSRLDSNHVLSKYNGKSDNRDCLPMLKSWAERAFDEDTFYRKVVMEAPEDTTVAPIYIYERAPTPETLQAPGRRVVLVGDSAHTMSMFRGEGGNHAIIDAGKLGEQIGLYFAGSKTLDEATGAYYEEMIPRCKKAVEDSHEAAIKFHTESPESMVKIYGELAERARSSQQQKQ